jgi:hypothetical protein
MSKAAALATDALRKRKRASKTRPFEIDGQVYDIAFVVLSHEEIREAEFDAVKYITHPDRKLDAVQLAILSPNALVEQERDLFVLAKAIREPGRIDMEIWSVDDLRKLSVEERIWLLAEYNAFAEERSPIKKAAKPEEVSAFIAELKRTRALSTWVQCCDGATLRDTVLSLAEALSMQTTPNSSDTSP